MKQILSLFLLAAIVGSTAAQPARRDERRSRSNGNRFQATDVAYPSEFATRVEGAYRVITANGIPDHQTGQFPNRGNPHSIAPQDYRYRIPAQPKPARTTTPLGMHPFGIAVNGVVFDPRAAEWWNGARNSIWQYEPLTSSMTLGADMNDAHVQPSGAYHYHGVPAALLKKKTGGSPKMILLGWAADGFPIYGPHGLKDPANSGSGLKRVRSSYQLRKGRRPSGSQGPGGNYDGSFTADWVYVNGSGDLDECNGRFGVTPDFPSGIYHYYLTEEFPFVPRRFRGTPDQGFMRHGGPGGRGFGGPPGGRGFGGPPSRGGGPRGNRRPGGAPPRPR